jgi:hypothetical protein
MLLNTDEVPGETTSLASFVLDIVDLLQEKAAEAVSPYSIVSIREITFSIPYDPGVDKKPLPFPKGKDGIPSLRLPRARRYLRSVDRMVALKRSKLLKTPVGRIARMELRIRVKPYERGSGSEERWQS